MNARWIAVLGTSAIAYLLKLTGSSIPEKIASHPRFIRISTFIPVALLSALVAVQTVANKTHLVIDHRIAGVTTALVALFFKLPFPVVVISAMVVSALVYRFG
jgi:branched-subunit amino acid transport protein